MNGQEQDFQFFMLEKGALYQQKEEEEKNKFGEFMRNQGALRRADLVAQEEAIKPKSEIFKDTLKGAAEDLFGGAREVFAGAKNVLGMVEAPYSIATGFAGFIPGLATKIISQLHPDISYAQAEELGDKVTEFITYTPKTEIGQMGAETLGMPFALLTETLDKAAEAMAPGDPNSQAVFRTLSWLTAIFAGPALKSRFKQYRAYQKTKGKPALPEDMKAIAMQEVERTTGQRIPAKVSKQEYPFMPADAPQIWRDIVDRGGIKRPKFEVEEFETGVPKALRRKDGMAPDDMAARLGFEYEGELYEAIEVRQRPTPEAEYYEQRAAMFEPPPTIQKPTPEKTIRALVEEKSVKEITELKEGKMPEEIAVLDKIIVERTAKVEKPREVVRKEAKIIGIEERPLSEIELRRAREAGKVEELPPSEKKPVSFEEEIRGEYPGVVEEISREIERKQVGREPKPGLAVEMVEPVPKMRRFKFQDAEIEGRFEAAKGIPREPLISRARQTLVSLKNKATRTFEHLPNIAEFSPAKQELKRLAKQRSVQSYNTLNTLRGITINFRDKPAQMDLFRRKVIMDDLVREAEIGHDLPFGFTKESVKAELSRLDASVGAYKPISNALKQRRRVWDAITKDYVRYAKRAGVDLEGKLEKPDYFRHQVLEYARAKGVATTGKRLGKPGKRGFLQERKGSEFDINTDYFEAEYEVMSQMLYDMEVYKTVKFFEKEYDISKKVRASAKKQQLENWHDAVPEGYEIWQPAEGNVFYLADTIPSRMAQDIMNDAIGDLGVVKDGLKKALAMGRKRKEWVIKSELAKTLNDLTQRERPSWMGRINKKILRAWKQWTLTSPRRHPKYNLRNLTGDADAVLVGNARGFKKVPKAISDLYDFLVLDKPLKGELKEWVDRGGMETTLQAQELGDIKGLRWFKEFNDKKGGVKDIPGNVWKKYWRVARLSTDFREAILRVANYYDYLDQIKAGKGKPKNYGASIPEEINALKNPRDKAFRLSNELLGAYDEISVFGQGIREQIFPFWSWKELNFRRYVRLFKNATRDNKTAMGVAKGIAPFLMKTPTIALRFGRFAIKATALTMILQAWNHLRFPDEERLLPDEVKGRTHIVLGRDKDGNIIFFSRLGALGDFLEWFGLDAAPNLVSEYLSGKKSIKDIAKHMARAPVNQVVQGLHPIKAGFEVLVRRSLFPDAFEPGTIRDRGEYIARSLGLENEYKAIKGKPGKPYVETLPLVSVYKVDPLESAYHQIYDEKRRFLKKIGREAEGFWLTPRGSALYDLKQAHRYGDKKAEKKALEAYIQLHNLESEVVGKTKEENLKAIERGLETSLLNMYPLSGLSRKQQDAFIAGLDVEDREILAKAIKFYNDVLLGRTPIDEQKILKTLSEAEK